MPQMISIFGNANWNWSWSMIPPSRKLNGGNYPCPERTRFVQRASERIESACRITSVSNPVHLVASHCKPWRDSTNEERLNGENGLLLTPSIDHLFDRGFIGFENNGALIISPVAHRPSPTHGHRCYADHQRGKLHERPKTVPGISPKLRPVAVKSPVALKILPPFIM